jgi:hypothetical protein
MNQTRLPVFPSSSSPIAAATLHRSHRRRRPFPSVTAAVCYCRLAVFSSCILAVIYIVVIF